MIETVITLLIVINALAGALNIILLILIEKQIKKRMEMKEWTG